MGVLEKSNMYETLPVWIAVVLLRRGRRRGSGRSSRSGSRSSGVSCRAGGCRFRLGGGTRVAGKILKDRLRKSHFPHNNQGDVQHQESNGTPRSDLVHLFFRACRAHLISERSPCTHEPGKSATAAGLRQHDDNQHGTGNKVQNKAKQEEKKE
jgi:hypothetical protein